jgi:NAD(P)-dependent dehydrogenase (short-subunit alcohol dehydrogenase family)
MGCAVDWQSKVVLITGAASGMGLAFARRFAAAGASLALADLQAERLAATAPTLGTASLAITADVARVADCAAMVSAAVARFGRLDLLINSAGVWVEGPAEEMGEGEWDRCLDINLKGTFFACRYAIPELRKTAGVIINIASDAGLMGSAGASIYCASKGGVVQLTRALALELAPDGVRCNAICPCDVDTPMLAGQAAVYGRGDPEGYTRKLRAIYPQGERTRFVRPEEVAEFLFAVAGLEPITGACLPIDFATTAGR